MLRHHDTSLFTLTSTTASEHKYINWSQDKFDEPDTTAISHDAIRCGHITVPMPEPQGRDCPASWLFFHIIIFRLYI